MVFCSPNDSMTVNEFKFNDRLNDEIFKSLKDIGINKLLGWGYDSREESIVKTLELCNKYSIDYYLQLKVTDRYLANGYAKKNYPDWRKLSDNEKEELDKEMISEISKYTAYESLKGVIFDDECGIFSYDAVLHAKDVISKTFPNLEFYTNFMGFPFDESVFFASFGNPPHVIKEEDKLFDASGISEFENRFKFYEIGMDLLLNKSDFLYSSFDHYPFERLWDEYPYAMERYNLELVAFFNYKKRENRTKTFNYLPVGKWFIRDENKDLLRSEYDLSMNVSLTYGSDGFAYFPGFYPIDFVVSDGYINSSNGKSGFIDINGNKTKFYEYQKENIKFLKMFENDFLNSILLGVNVYGKYYNGLSKDEIRNLKWNEALYDGTIPDYLKKENQDIKVSACSNSLLVGEFLRNSKERFYITNMSTLYDNEIDIIMPEGEYILYKRNKRTRINNILKIKLDAGEGIYIKRI